MTASRDWKSRWLAITILVLACMGVFEGLVVPIADSMQESEATIERAHAAIARYHAIIAGLPRLRDELLRKKIELTSGRILAGAALPEVNAELQARVRAIVSVAGATIQGSRILTPIVEESLSKFGVQLDLRATPEQLAAITKLVEGKEGTLFVDSLEVSVPENGEGQLDSQGQPVTNASFQISGYSLIPLDPQRKQ